MENRDGAHQVGVTASVDFLERENAPALLLKGLHGFLSVHHILGVHFVFNLFRDMLIESLEEVAHDGFLGNITLISIGNGN